MYPMDYLENKILLSTSIFFTSIFNHLKKKNNQNVEGIQNIFEQAQNHFRTITFLFEKIPNPKIDDEIFEVCLKAVKKNNNRVKAEMNLIQNYFKVYSENSNKFEEIGDSLLLYSQKKELINTINGIILFIEKKNQKILIFLIV